MRSKEEQERIIQRALSMSNAIPEQDSEKINPDRTPVRRDSLLGITADEVLWIFPGATVIRKG